MLTREIVEKIAHLSRLSFTEAELDEQFEQLKMIMDMMDGLKEIDTEGVTPLNHVMDIHNVFRSDEVKPGMPLDQVLANAPDETDGMFQVPKIV